MSEKIIFREKQKLAVPIVCAFLGLISLFFISLGAFTVSIDCTNRTCTSDVTSLFSLVRTTHTIRDVSIVQTPSRRTSKGGITSNVVFGNAYESARVWSMDSTMNKDLQADVATWLRQGASGLQINEVRQDWNLHLPMSFMIIFLAFMLHRTEKQNRLNPATIILDESVVTLIDLGGNTMRFGLNDIDIVTVANAEEIIRQRSPIFFKMGGLKWGGKRSRAANGIIFETKMGKSFVVSNYTMSDTDIHVAITRIKKYIAEHRKDVLTEV